MKRKHLSLVLFFLVINSFYIISFASEKGKEPQAISKPLSGNYMVNFNNIFLPMDDKGTFADVNNKGGRYGDKIFLFSGGFFLSGKIDETVWGNGVCSSSRVIDYLSGPAFSTVPPEYHTIYVVKKNDPPFGESWVNWAAAVLIGADFYDGDNDGIYNPVDKNNNGVWDTNEDKPDIIGDFTAWCCYNDGLNQYQRRFTDVSPKGIDIRQSVFGFQSNGSKTDNLIMIRYRISNNGSVANVLDSVYFSATVDPDLGDYTDDLLCCDTSLSASFVYNNGPDKIFGSAPPCFAVDLFQGPVSYIPGVTFKDNNNNGKFDAGDTPLKYALNIKGNTKGIDTIQGAMNMPMTSFTQYMQSHPTNGDPDNKEDLRYYLTGGKGKHGIPLNPCTWAFGNAFGIVDCYKLNPKFMYSGDPVSGKGWINTTPQDQRMLVNTGPFKLEKNKPIDIIVAYILAQGTSAINSVTLAKSYTAELKDFFNSNFSKPTTVNNENTIVASYELNQNYPNPFNPSTVIKYSIPSAQKVNLVIYNNLGQKVKTLVDNYQESGSHEVVFNAGDLCSGVYFYRLSAGNFSEVKKLMLIK